jgi:hypothetical protein
MDWRFAMTRRISLVCALAMIGLGGAAAWAGNLATPTLLSPTASYRLLCMATNVGPKARPVSVELVNSDDGSMVATQACPSVAPGTSCYAASDYGSLNGHCRFGGKAKLRAAIWLQGLASNGAIVTTLPATSR